MLRSGLLVTAVHRLLIDVASLVVEHRRSSWGPHASLLHSMWGLPRPGLGPQTLLWQVDSYSLNHQGSPKNLLFIMAA